MPLPRAKSEPGLESLVSRHSGLAAGTGTFGKGTRFAEKLIGKGCESPRGDAFYSNVRLYKSADEWGKSCSLGAGQRSSVLARSAPPLVGPGSYSSLNSVTKSRSPLDGPVYCTTTLKARLGSSLVAKSSTNTPSPQTYNVRKEVHAHLPNYNGPRMKHGGRSRFQEDNDGPGFDYNSHNLKADSIWTSTPSPRTPLGATAGGRKAAGDVSALESATGGSKKFLKSTFGMSQRFKDGKTSSTPSGSMYYAHCRVLNGEDYMTSGATAMGFGSKVDFANPLKNYQSQVSPASYSPRLAGTGKMSPLDGFTVRACTSPAMANRTLLMAKRDST